MRVVRLGDGRAVPLGAYVAAWRKVLAAPADASFNRSLTDRWPADRETLLGEFRDGLHDRINKHLPGYRKGRKWDSDWQRATLQAADRLNTPRLAIDWLPQWLKGRFSHRLRNRDDW